MRAVVQRVDTASVKVNGLKIAQIARGLLVLIGIEKEDNEKDLEYIKNKILNLRIFENEQGLFHYSIKDIQGQILLVSQFTLFGDCKKGNRPSFTDSMPVEQARAFYPKIVESFKNNFPETFSGEFQAEMSVELVNNGPVTLILDSKN